MEKLQKRVRDLNDVRKIFSNENLKTEIEKALQNMTADQIEILKCRFYANQSAKEIAIKNNCSAHQINKIVRKGLLCLREHFAPTHYEEANRILYGKLSNQISF